MHMYGPSHTPPCLSVRCLLFDEAHKAKNLVPEEARISKKTGTPAQSIRPPDASARPILRVLLDLAWNGGAPRKPKSIGNQSKFQPLSGTLENRKNLAQGHQQPPNMMPKAFPGTPKTQTFPKQQI